MVGSLALGAQWGEFWRDKGTTCSESYMMIYLKHAVAYREVIFATVEDPLVEKLSPGDVLYLQFTSTRKSCQII